MGDSDSKLSHARVRARTVAAAAIVGGLLIVIGSGAVLANGNPFAKYPPAKAAILQREQNAIATAQANAHATKPTHYTPPPSAPAATPVTGIEGLHQGPFPACQFSVNNFWQGPVNGQWELVYAGTKNSNIATCSNGQGALAIYSEEMGRYGDGPVTTIGTFTVPTSATSLTITGVNGGDMSVRTNTGATLTFDLHTNTFTSGS
ncbi:MAG TPA: hypothetical protein VF725_04295 [Ktedonobacterales bacterium]